MLVIYLRGILNKAKAVKFLRNKKMNPSRCDSLTEAKEKGAWMGLRFVEEFMVPREVKIYVY
jgi:hypothetical protein